MDIEPLSWFWMKKETTNYFVQRMKPKYIFNCFKWGSDEWWIFFFCQFKGENEEDLTTKWLRQFLNKRKTESGFTLRLFLIITISVKEIKDTQQGFFLDWIYNFSGRKWDPHFPSSVWVTQEQHEDSVRDDDSSGCRSKEITNKI